MTTISFKKKMHNNETDLAEPEGLSAFGKRARKVILDVLNEHSLMETGGCTTFYAPKFWVEERGESYGKSSELIVVYDGSDLRNFFNLDYAWPTYTLYEKMRTALEGIGCYFEECTCWYAAVYKR